MSAVIARSFAQSLWRRRYLGGARDLAWQAPPRRAKGLPQSFSSLVVLMRATRYRRRTRHPAACTGQPLDGNDALRMLHEGTDAQTLVACAAAGRVPRHLRFAWPLLALHAAASRGDALQRRGAWTAHGGTRRVQRGWFRGGARWSRRESNPGHSDAMVVRIGHGWSVS